MSYDHSKRVWATDLKGGKLLVMLALAQHADDKGMCYPGEATLAQMARVSDRQVRRILNSLEKSGHIVIEQRAIGRGKKPTYRLFPCEKADKMSAIDAHNEVKEDKMSDIKAEEMSTIEQESGQNVHLNGVGPEKADISDSKSGHFDTVKADISAPIQSHARSEHHLEHQEELREKEKPHARDPLTVAWEQVYADVPMPPKLATSLKELAAECSIAAAIHGIKASAAKEDGRNFRYIAECARNYVPPAPLASYASEPGYQVDLPGVHLLEPPATNGHAPPPLPPPVAHDDPWAIALAELSGVLPGSAPAWLEGSTLQESGELAGVPFYRVLLTDPRANAQWLTQQAEPAVRKKLSSLLRTRILVEFVEAQQAVHP